MFGQHFYHKSIRNTVIAFGTIFNNINIRRLDSSGNPLQKIRVPLSYAPKEKFIARLDQNANLTGSDSSVAITLPRMSFDVNSYRPISTASGRALRWSLKLARTKRRSSKHSMVAIAFCRNLPNGSISDWARPT